MPRKSQIPQLQARIEYLEQYNLIWHDLKAVVDQCVKNANDENRPLATLLERAMNALEDTVQPEAQSDDDESGGNPSPYTEQAVTTGADG